MELTLKTYLIVCPLVFFAGFVDSVAGGGGLISLPAYVFAGLPIHFAYGTNKTASSFGTAVATFEFAKNGKIRLRPALIAAAGSLIGGAIGSQLVMILSPEIVQIVMMICLPIVAVFLLTRKSVGGDIDNFVNGKKENTGCFIIGLFIGWYDGFVGPGTGTFLIIAFTTLLGYSMITATANAKVVNLASNAASMVTYIIGGKVLFSLAIPAMICCSLGNYIGSKMAIKRGSKFIKPLMTFVIVMLFIKIAYDFAASRI